MSEGIYHAGGPEGFVVKGFELPENIDLANDNSKPEPLPATLQILYESKPPHNELPTKEDYQAIVDWLREYFDTLESELKPITLDGSDKAVLDDISDSAWLYDLMHKALNDPSLIKARQHIFERYIAACEHYGMCNWPRENVVDLRPEPQPLFETQQYVDTEQAKEVFLEKPPIADSPDSKDIATLVKWCVVLYRTLGMELEEVELPDDILDEWEAIKDGGETVYNQLYYFTQTLEELPSSRDTIENLIGIAEAENHVSLKAIREATQQATKDTE